MRYRLNSYQIIKQKIFYLTKSQYNFWGRWGKKWVGRCRTNKQNIIFSTKFIFYLNHYQLINIICFSVILAATDPNGRSYFESNGETDEEFVKYQVLQVRNGEYKHVSLAMTKTSQKFMFLALEMNKAVENF